ncbi:MAG: UDP-N-acetylmuramate dehydrogenase, partial [Telluria sp.]
MQPDLAILPDFPLLQLNTFGIAARARAFLTVTALDQLRAIAADPALSALPRLLLGGGSNIVLTGDVDALVLHMAIGGKEVIGTDGARTLVRCGGGEPWHGFVQWTLAQGLGGLENMSLIPGTVGAAPIQNIGAYGTELKDVFHSLTVFDMGSGQTRVMDAQACRFGYRDSMFKHGEGAGLVIVDVTFALAEDWQPNLRYAELAQAVAAAGLSAPTAREISDIVVAIRQRKLPDPAVIGNAGSFF